MGSPAVIHGHSCLHDHLHVRHILRRCNIAQRCDSTAGESLRQSGVKTEMQRTLAEETTIVDIDTSVANVTIATSSDTTAIQINGHHSVFLTEYSQSRYQPNFPFISRTERI